MKIWSQICEKVIDVSKKLLLEINAKKEKIETKAMKAFTIVGGFWGPN